MFTQAVNASTLRLSTAALLPAVINATPGLKMAGAMGAKTELASQLAQFCSAMFADLQITAPELAGVIDSTDLDGASRAEWARLAQLAGVRSESYAGYLHARIGSRVLFGQDDQDDDFEARAKVARFMIEQTHTHLGTDAALDWVEEAGDADWWSCDAAALLKLFKTAPSDFCSGMIAGVAASRIERGDLR